jgi:hypothetical protein
VDDERHVEERKFGIYYEDEYDYLQHLKPPGSAVLEPVGLGQAAAAGPGSRAATGPGLGNQKQVCVCVCVVCTT